MTIICDDMATYYELRAKQRAVQERYRDARPDPADITVQEQILLENDLQPPPLQVVVDFWLAELVKFLKKG